MSKTHFRVFILFVAFLFPFIVHAETRSVSSNGYLITGEYEQRVLELVNAVRQENGLDALVLDTDMTLVARQRAAELGAYYNAQHLRSNLSGFKTILDDFQIEYKYASENIAYGYGLSTYTTPEGVVNVWLGSTVHRNNILNSNYTSLGIGIFKGPSNYYYWIQDFSDSISEEYYPDNQYQEVMSLYKIQYEEYNSDFEYEPINDLELNVGDYYYLSYPISTYNAGSSESISLTLYDWTSSNPEIVSITNQGTVVLHANHTGTSTIQTSFQDQVISFQVTVGGENPSHEGWIQIQSSNDTSIIHLTDITDEYEITLESEYGIYHNVTQFNSNEEVMNPSSYQLSYCEDANCSTSIKPTQYQSLDEDVCAYIQGDFIFHNRGHTTMTAVFENGLTVHIPVSVIVFQFDEVEYSLGIGESIQTQFQSDIDDYTFSSSDEDIFLVQTDGTIVGISEGETILSAVSDSGITTNAKVSVHVLPQIHINIVQYDVVLVENEEQIISVSTDPNNASISYHSDDANTVSVDANGKMIGHHEGNTVIHITARYEHYKECSVDITVTVIKPEILVESIQVDKASILLEVGEEDIIHASVLPSNATYSNLHFESMNPSFVTVDDNGKVSAIAAGDTVITITATGGISISIPVSIHRVEITELILNTHEVLITDFDSTIYVESFLPNHFDYHEDELEWIIENPNIVRIDNHKLIPLQYGETTITARYEDVTDSCHVVVSRDFSNTTLGSFQDSIRNFESHSIQYALVNRSIQYQMMIPSYLRTIITDENLSWSSSNPQVLEVDQTGMVSFRREGYGVITATFGMYSSDLYFYVYGLNIDSDESAIYVGDTTKISVEVVTPNSYHSHTGIFKVSDEEIATISEDGILTGIRPGTVIVTVTSDDYKVSKSIKIEIMALPRNEFNVVFEQNTFTVENKNGKVVLSYDDVTISEKENISLSSNEELISIYDIHFIVGSNSTFDQPIYHVMIPITFDINQYESVYVAYIVNGVIKEVLNSYISGSFLEFDTTHFSHYAIIGLLKSKSNSVLENDNSITSNNRKTNTIQNQKSNNLETGNHIIIYVIIWIIAFLLLNRFITLLFHKKKE